MSAGGAPGGPRSAVTFDLWYTLVYLGPDERRSFEARRRGIWAEALTTAGLAPEKAHTWVRQLEITSDQLEVTGEAPKISDLVAWLRERTGRSFDTGYLESRLGALVADGGFQLAPGARSALATLRSAGLRCGLVSNIVHEPPWAIRKLLDRLGLLPYFRSIVLSSEVGAGKPKPEPFQRCLSELGAPAHDAAHVGNSGSDVVGARAAGLQPIFYTGLRSLSPRSVLTPLRSIPPEVPRFRSWAELPGLVGLARPRAGAPGKPPTEPRVRRSA
ncbi:MAG TPA: HAD family hydrolase [Thermoplasmata archaeon]|nr:HAD family hydrolase [Thermoplasmata archaeon]